MELLYLISVLTLGVLIPYTRKREKNSGDGENCDRVPKGTEVWERIAKRCRKEISRLGFFGEDTLECMKQEEGDIRPFKIEKVGRRLLYL